MIDALPGPLLAAVSLPWCLGLAAVLFSVGVFGVLARRNLIVILMSLEIMLNSVNLALVAFNRAHRLQAVKAQPDLAAVGTFHHGGQIFVLMVLAVAAAEAAVGLAILVALYRDWRTTDTSGIDRLKG